MTATTTTATRADASTCGLPPEQVQAWLGQVQDDVRRVRARLEYLRAEETRLVAQQQLLAELLASSAGPL
jgi:hypothetical protein